jgi:hypothetical protein
MTTGDVMRSILREAHEVLPLMWRDSPLYVTHDQGHFAVHVFGDEADYAPSYAAYRDPLYQMWVFQQQTG